MSLGPPPPPAPPLVLDLEPRRAPRRHVDTSFTNEVCDVCDPFFGWPRAWLTNGCNRCQSTSLW